MNELRLFQELQEAWNGSTPSNNLFSSKLDSIEWTTKFYADGEHNFLLGDFTFCTPTLNPFFEGCWKPNATFSDYSYLEFK